MKLIDILVSELPNLGGWPDGVIKMSQDYDGEVWCWRGHGYGNVNSFARISEIADNHRKQSQDEELSCFVTREQYEAALAASKPEWDGERLPPVGCECMVRGEIGDDGWYECKVIAHTFFDGYNCAVFQTESTVSCSSEGNFRPIRSEADKKRETFVNEANELVGDIDKYPTWLSAIAAIYDAIKSGKIVID
ncbi:hypothetical protein ACR9GW_01115 [Enterobacter ludwigii]